MAQRSARKPLRRAAASGGAILLAFLAQAIQPPRADAVVWPRIALVPVTAGLAQPVKVTNAGDGSGDLFVVEQAGTIRIVRNGALLPVPFLDITGRVLSGGERGLLGLAFSPGYATNRAFYVNYTRTGDGATVIARYRVAGTSADVADPATEEPLLVIEQPFGNHNGGDLAFGPDGFLYITTGDGGSGGDPFDNAQNTNSLLGKILRIDVGSGAAPYAIPSSNPFVGLPGSRGEIWALGLRNPWRFAFDRDTGDLYIGDVGEGAFEEVDFQPASSAGGENYGWNVLEGNHCFPQGALCDPGGFTPPVAEYDHTLGCSVTGGAVYRGQAHPSLRGIYLYADFCSGRIWGLAREGNEWTNELLLTEPRSLSSFGEDESGNLYATDLAGALVEIAVVNAPPEPPALLFPADNQAGLSRSVTFEWKPSADPDGDAVTYRFFLDTDPSFPGTVPVVVPVLRVRGRGDDRGGGGAPSPILLGAVSLVLVLLLSVRRRRGPVLTAAPAAACLLAAAIGCGGGSPVAPAAPAPEPAAVSHAVSGLAPAATYYWKVAAADAHGSTDSETRSFRTAP